jgi:hypothetical protein
MKKLVLLGVVLALLVSTSSVLAQTKEGLVVKMSGKTVTTIEFFLESLSKEKVRVNVKPFTFDEAKSEKAIAADFHPGKGTALVDTTREGNILALCHSAYYNDIPLECEKLRELVQGGTVSKMLPVDQVKQNLLKIVGSNATIKQGKLSQQFRIAAGILVPHESLGEFEKDTKNVTTFLLSLDLDETTKATVEKMIEDDKTYILLTFCGWGPPSAHEWWLWERFIIVLEPIE